MFSSRSKNAIKVLLYLYENQNKGLVPLKNIALDEDLSLKYLEHLMPVLIDNDYVSVKRGKDGGYQLKKDGEQINIWDILNLFEVDLYPVSELSHHQEDKLGKTLEMWQNFYQLEKDYFVKITLKEISEKEYVLDFVI